MHIPSPVMNRPQQAVTAIEKPWGLDSNDRYSRDLLILLDTHLEMSSEACQVKRSVADGVGPEW